MEKEIKEILAFDWVKPQIIEDIAELVEGKPTGDRVMRVLMKFQDTKINSNGRSYSAALLRREVERLKPLCKEGKVLGAAFHPDREHQVPDTALLWEDIEIKENGECFGTAKILPTSVGRDAQVIVRNGGHIGVSSRGRGTMTEVEEEVDGVKRKFFRVNDDYKMAVPGDLVITPSVPDAGLLKVLESRRNRADGSIVEDVKGDNNVDKFKNVDEFKEAYPEMFKGIVETTTVAVEATIAEKVAAAVEGAKTKIAEELEPKITELEEKDKAVRAGVAEAIGALKKLVGEEEEPSTEEGEVEKRLGLLETENAALKAKVTATEVAATAAKVEVELQKELAPVLETELAKSEYVKYATSIRKDLVVEGKIMADSKEDLVMKVAGSFMRVTETIAEAKKQGIISGDILDKGIISDPNNPPKPTEKVERTEDEKMAMFEKYSAAAGMKKMSYKQFVEGILPKIDAIQE